MSLKVGSRVFLKDKELYGTVAYVGMTEFAAGKWIGVVLDEPKGKNNGTVQGKQYFQCDDNFGAFVRQTQISLADEDPSARPSSRASTTSTQSSKDISPKTEMPAPVSSLKSAPTKLASPRSSIPKPGASRLSMTAQKGPTAGRSPSFTNLKAKENKDSKSPRSAVKKERSFIEKDFRQTVTSSPASTPSSSGTPSRISSAAPGLGSVATSSPASAMSERIEERLAAAQAQQELLQAKDSIRDLEEKMETLKIKRAKDQEKLKDFEKLSLQNEQLMEFKSRIMEAQSTLQKELQKAKHEAREAIEAKEKHADEMSELSETVEMATLDKEMAEEKAESLQIELDSAKDRIEELTLDLDIIKAEMGDGDEAAAGGSGVTNFEVKQLKAQNEKLTSTLVGMRDLLAHEKNEHMKLSKELDEKSTQNNNLTKQNQKLSSLNDELENTITDLQEQVDAALGSEEMIENLTTKCLDMEDRIVALIEEKEDLEKLHELDEELQENARDEEMRMIEEHDLAQAKIREITRSRDAAYEIIADHEKTIKNFREYVKKVQDQNSDLRTSLEKETNKPVTTPAEMINFKAIFEGTKAHTKAIDMEMRICEENQAKEHVRYLSYYMSESFMQRGGDNEAVLVLLLVSRMIWKANILLTQVKEGFSFQDKIDKESVLKSHDVEKGTFGNQMIHFLNALIAQLQQFSSALGSCNPETFLRIGTLYPEMAVHERSVDFYIELLKKSQLDENVPIDNLERGLQYFQTIYPQHLESEKLDFPSFLKNHVTGLYSAINAIAAELEIGNVLLTNDQQSSEVGILLKNSTETVDKLKQLLKSMKRRLPHDENVEALVSFPLSSAAKFSDTLKSLSLLVKAFHVFGKSITQHAGLQGESEISAIKISEVLHQAIDKVYEFNENGLDTVKNGLNEALNVLTELNNKYQNGDWDIDKLPVKQQPPVELRALNYKAEIKEAESIKYKIEKKDSEIKEMKIAIREKMEEISEMQVRKDKAEKKLLDATRDSDLMREKLQRKVDDAQTLLKKKEKEYEDTIKHFQRDIEELEDEKGELKEKIKDFTKQTLFKEIKKNLPPQTSSVSGPTSLGPSVPMPIRDSPLLKQQLQDTQAALLAVKDSQFDRQMQELGQKLAKMKPLKVPKSILITENEKADSSKDDGPSITDLMKKVQNLQKEFNNVRLDTKVVDLTKTNPGAHLMSHNLQRKARIHRIENEVEKLRMDVIRIKASRKIGGEVSSDITQFPSNQFAKSLSEVDYKLIGKLTLPNTLQQDKENLSKIVPVIVTRNDLQKIHQTITVG